MRQCVAVRRRQQRPRASRSHTWLPMHTGQKQVHHVDEMHATVPPDTQAPPVPHPLLTEQLPLGEAGWRGGGGGVASRAAAPAWPLGLQ